MGEAKHTATPWTHRYHYMMESQRYIPRVGYVITGMVQVAGEYSPDQVEALAKRLFHGTVDDAKLVDVRLIQVRSVDEARAALAKAGAAA